jgi:L-lactate dehydrogenase complex protein LldG
MSTARDAMLQTIHAALLGAPEPAPIPRGYRHQTDEDQVAILADFVDKVRDYRAEVRETTEADLPAAIAAVCRQHNVRRLVTPVDIPVTWVPEEVETLRDMPQLPNEELDRCDGVLTGCALGIAETGTIVLDGGALQGRRALSLVPDLHLCVVLAEHVVGLVPEAIEWLARDPMRPITFISGPSATSDIELVRVEGVHGPRTLVVFVVDTSAARIKQAL